MTPHKQNSETPIMSDTSDNISDKSLPDTDRQALRDDITARYENTLRSLDDAPKVEQCDREAAADLVGPMSNEGRYPGFACDFRVGRSDKSPLVQAFARHRIAAEANRDQLGIREMIATDGWRPIESAPTNWTQVDLWVVWQGLGQRITDCRSRLANGKPDWHTTSDEYGWTQVHGTPTHWMPLPAPPQSKRAAALADLAALDGETI